MTSQTAQSLPFAKFTRSGFAFPSRARDTKNKLGDDEDWYIPYNGPYEAPREPTRREKVRDSWGDLVEDYHDNVLDDKELHLRYGGHNDLNSRSSSGKPVEEERKGRSRDRSFSVISGRTTSSGAMDPGRGSLTINRRSTVSASSPPPMPSYVNLDAVGSGVGESPVPHLRNSKEGHRISIASIFSFGGSNRKAPPSPVVGPGRSNSGLKVNTSQATNTKPRQDKKKGYGRTDIQHLALGVKESKHRLLHDQVMTQGDRISSIATDEEEYYNSYYQTLIHKPEHDRSKINQPYYQNQSPTASADSRTSSQRHRDYTGISRQNSTSTTSGHPYAYPFPNTEISPGPRTAPPTSVPHTALTAGPSNPPRLVFTTAGPSSADAAQSAFSPRTAGLKQLKNSSSTPNLRSPVLSPVQPNNTNTGLVAPKFVFPKGKERWLSAETWCDALLFPRPRLRLKQEIVEGQYAPVSSGRIVSPPTTPTGQEFAMQQQQREPGIASRVLAHSRSLVDLNKGKGKMKEEEVQPSILQDRQTSRAGALQTLRPPRPKSFAQDDLALLSPVPSLAHVLRDGEMLDAQRKAWQIQAEKSFGNKRSRSISRTRSKSLTQKARRGGHHHHQSSMEYIAAQACLGTQNLTPTIVPARMNMSFSDSNTITSSSGKGSHSHSNSLVKSLNTKSSKSHSRTHSRNDSWSKSALKMAKSTVICGFPAVDDASPRGPNRFVDLEGALRSHGTKVIRLADPAHLPVDRGLPIHPSASASTNQYNAPRKTPSPAFSAISESKVGIALGTPPEEDSDAGVNYIPSHPYAQGGLSFSNAPPAPEHRHVDFAGPHPSINTSSKVPQISEILARHKLPPHMVLHPYAQQTSNRDSYLDANGLIGQYRSEDGTPHPSKMWAQLSPGVVREILPHDLQYSPFMPENGQDSLSPSNRHPISINDTVGVGETLVNAARFRGSQDSGLGTSESHANSSQKHHQQPKVAPPAWNQETEEDSHPSLFDSSRPMEVTRKPSDRSMNHPTFSSELEYLPVPSFDRQQGNSSPGVTSEDSSPPQSLRPLGSPHDLESFQDLFYRPNINGSQRTPNEAALPETPSPPHRSSIPWDINMRNRRTDSSLTSLARQLTDEFEQMALEQERTSSQYSQSATSSSRQQSSLMRRPTEGSLQFVFEEMRVSESPPAASMADPIHAFKPSETLPEDVLSSRASSFIENNEDDDPTARFRVGMVESVSTPPAVSSEHRLSFNGQTAFVHPAQDRRHGLALSPNSLDSHARVLSGLQAPTTDATRSSYMTSSTLSRMSGLSDFPAPPKDNHVTPKHMSLLSSYFDEALSQSESHSEPLPPAPVLLEEDRVTFGGNQNADDLAKTLSSPLPEPF
ncbi:hypothetical protein BDZ97DRAFT_1844340 [Flammula alnicola]|nr:hypothetical protein BDZ97DRAFT_1844340 [Flammula alnicola]